MEKIYRIARDNVAYQTLLRCKLLTNLNYDTCGCLWEIRPVFNGNFAYKFLNFVSF